MHLAKMTRRRRGATAPTTCSLMECMSKWAEEETLEDFHCLNCLGRHPARRHSVLMRTASVGIRVDCVNVHRESILLVWLQFLYVHAGMVFPLRAFPVGSLCSVEAILLDCNRESENRYNRRLSVGRFELRACTVSFAILIGVALQDLIFHPSTKTKAVRCDRRMICALL